jgi:hypothetical protein
MGLQLFELMGNCRLGQMHPSGGAGEIAGFDQRQEGLQMTKFEYGLDHE